MLFEIAFATQLIVFVVYWVAIHNQIKQYIDSKGEWFRIYMCALHIVPFVCIFIDFVISQQVIYMRDIKFMLIFGVVYTFNNFLQTKMFVRKPYPFMTWEGVDSLVAFLAIL